MQHILDTIQAIARQRGRSEAGPLLKIRDIEQHEGERVSHIPIDQELAQAWQALLGEPFRPHQAQAITSLRRGEPVALLASNPRVILTTYLLLYAMLGQRNAAGVLIAPSAQAAQTVHAQITQLNERLPATYRLTAHLTEPSQRPNPYASLLITTPDGWHNRLLRHHDRAWSLLWPKVQMLALLDIHRYHGVAGSHVADLMLRTQRVAAAHGSVIPHLIATGWELDEPLPALEAIYNAPWKVLSGNDLPSDATKLAVWRGSADRLREAADLATAIQKQGCRVHILCQPIEQLILTPMLGKSDEISFGPEPQTGHVVICAGYPSAQSALQQLLRSGYQLVILVLGDAPYEQMLSRHDELALNPAASTWPPSPINTYVTAQNILCAAAEIPLTEAEVHAIGIGDIVERLASSGQLIDLPDIEVAWRPGPQADDPYQEHSLISASGGATLAYPEKGAKAATPTPLDPSGLERWYPLNAALPPTRGGLRVVAHDVDQSTIGLRIDTGGRRTMPLRRCTVTPRDERDQRPLFLSNNIGIGRAVVEEEIYGMREISTQGSPAEPALRPSLSTRWIAPCCWIDLPTTPPASGQLIGWSLAAAVEYRTVCAMQDVVPCYVPEKKRLYFVESQPGGNGLASWIYANVEDLLPLAYDIALSCRHDPLLEPVARADMDWLLPLLGKRDPAAKKSGEKLILVPAPEPAPQLIPARPEPLQLLRPAPQPAPQPAKPAPQPVRPAPQPAKPAPQAAPPTPQPAKPAPQPVRQTVPAPQPAKPVSPTPQPVRQAAPPPAQPTTQSAPPPMRPAPQPVPQPTKPAPPEPATPAAQPSRPAPQPEPARKLSRKERKEQERKEHERREQERKEQERKEQERKQALEAQRAQRQAEPTRQAPPPRQPEPTRQTPPPRQPEPTRQAPPAPRQPEPQPALPDANALIERLRRQREQRESQRAQAEPPRPASSAPAVLRFSVGDVVMCLPYGQGTVRASGIDDGREILRVSFPEHGELTIDPAVSMVRTIQAADAAEDDDLL
ncbi:helicase [Chloroflexia bacterium SDU3-3]|nr:helicase [Chloroflexia bacterium SDU3-3]